MKARRVFALVLILILAVALCPPQPARAASRYAIGVDVSNQIVTVYAADSGEIVRQMICSSGGKYTGTVIGTFSLPKKRNKLERTKWYTFLSDGETIFAHYATRIFEGIMFHSYLYTNQTEKSVSQKTVALLGVPVSHGCVRLRPDDAQWIAENCPPGTKVKVYKSDERTDYVRELLKLQSYSIDDGLSYAEFVGAATVDGELGYGSRGDAVSELQARMTSLGLYSGDVSGVYDGDVFKTVQTLQTALGLEATGKVNKGLWELLFSDIAPTSSLANVSVGMSGKTVSYAQALLKKAAVYDGEINGVFDADTDIAVRRLQSFAGLEADGVLTDAQFRALQKLVKELPGRFPNGYVMRQVEMKQPMGTVITNVRVNLRKKASKRSDIVGQLEPEDVVEVLDTVGEWSKVQHDDLVGYVMTEFIKKYDRTYSVWKYLEEPNPGVMAFDETAYAFTPLLSCEEIVLGTGVNNENMIFYSKCSRFSQPAFGLVPRSSIEIEDTRDGWAKASYCGATGYIPTADLALTNVRVLSSRARGAEAGGVILASPSVPEEVTIYGGVSRDSEILGTISSGDELRVTIQGDEWSQVEFNGETAYVENDKVSIRTVYRALEEYMVSAEQYLSMQGEIEGVTVMNGNFDLVAAINSEEAIPEVNLTAEAADALNDDDLPWADKSDEFDPTAAPGTPAGAGSAPGNLGYEGEDIDTSAARAAFDAADAEVAPNAEAAPDAGSDDGE